MLEDGLRRIATARGVTHDPKAGARTLNGKLAGAAVHTALEQRRLDVAIQVRNDADHGNFDQVDVAAVTEMLSIVEAYLAAHLTPSPAG